MGCRMTNTERLILWLVGWILWMVLVAPPMSKAAVVRVAPERALAIANAAWPGSKCENQIEPIWLDSWRDFPNPSPGTYGYYLYDGSCRIYLLKRLKGTVTDCTAMVHESGHAAGTEYLIAHGYWPLDSNMHTMWTGSVMDPNSGDGWPACKNWRTRRQQAEHDVRARLPHGTQPYWTIHCTVGTTRCRASWPGHRDRRFAIPAYGQARQLPASR